MAKKRARPSSGESSVQPSPLPSDSDTDTSETPPKKSKPSSAEKAKKGPKTSKDICAQHNLKDVELEYTEADYQNLTNYGLFVRMVRPQVSEANPKISSSKMAALMEAKWREFREGNPFTKRRREEEEKKRLEEKKKLEQEVKKKHEEKIRKEEERMRKDQEKKEKEKHAKKKKVSSDEEEDDVDEDTEEEEEEEEEDDRRKHKSHVSVRPLTVKLSMPSPKSKSARESSEDEEDETNDEDDEEDEEQKPKPKRSQPVSIKMFSIKSKEKARKIESEEENGDLEDDDEEDEEEEDSPQPIKKKSQTLRVRLTPVPRKTTRDKKPVQMDASDASDDDNNDEDDTPKSKRRSQRSQATSSATRQSGRKSRSTEWARVDDSDDEGDSSDRSGYVASKRKKIIKDSSEDNSDSQTTEDSDLEDSRKRRMPKRQATKKAKVPSEEDDESEEDKKSRKKKAKRVTPQASDQDYSDSDDVEEEEEDSDISDDEDDDEYSGKRRRQKEGRGKPKIPGERKSERSRKVISNMATMSDKDFEKMLAKEEWEKKVEKKRDERKKEKEKKKKKERHDLKKKWELEGKKGPWQGKEGEEDDGNESDHYWYCEKCKDGGNLLLCDTCPRSYHQACLKLEVIPEGDWSCPKCKGDEPVSSSSESEEEYHESFCKVCSDGGDVILCDFCPCVYHARCLNPPLKQIPEGEWKCPRCVTAEKPLKGKIKQILTWRWSHQPKGQDELDHTHSPIKKTLEEKKVEENGENSRDSVKEGEKPPERELFVRFHNYAYWDCEWISELQLEIFFPMLFSMFKKKWDLLEPPALEDGSSFGKKRHRPRGGVNVDDPFNLEDKFYRYGIKPEWLQVHRIINHDGHKNNRSYLVKWRDLPYDDSTWEDPNQIPDGLQDWDKHVDYYWTHRKEKLNEKKKPEKIPKKSSLKKKMDEQPDYISKTGGKLHGYQLEGINWLRFSWAQDTNTILADEMGLGKTIQAITFIYGLWKEGHLKGPFMISAPLSTVPNWEREFEFWAPELYVVNYSGGKDTRMVLREHEFSFKEGAFASLKKPGKLREGHKPKFDVLLTSYEMPCVDTTTLQSIKWDILVVDEAHRLKSNQSLYFRTMSQYSIKYKLLLTGTPLQNNLEELFNLLNFMQPGKFNDMEAFLDSFHDISKDEQVTKLHDMLAPHMLRRMKCDVLKDMPSKSEFIVRVELSQMQKKFYKHILTKNFEALNVRGHSNQTALRNIMMDLRKCCNHPYLFPAAETDAPLTKKGLYEQTGLVKSCGKLELLEKMLKVCQRDKHRVLIFSQMTRVMDVLEDFLENAGFGYERIDGSIMGSVRQNAIDRFNSEDSKSMVFLLSTKAGGLGINLATADTVIIYDMDWNPHNDIQAFSRAHRIGQKNKVMIYRFVSRNTIEERMTQVCKKKMMLTELIIHRGMNQVKTTEKAEKAESLTKKEMNEILKFGAENLFKDTEEGTVVYDEAAIEKLMDRSQEGEVVAEDDQTKIGMNEYLRSFKVASYQVKEDAANEEEAEEEKEEEEEAPTVEEDSLYWERVLGDSYKEHRTQILHQQAEIAMSLGKGKRVRRQVKYFQPESEPPVPIRGRPEKKPEPEEEDEVEVDERLFSDYEPDSSASDNDSDEEEEQGAPSGGDDENADPDFMKAKTGKRGRPNKEPKAAKIKPQSTELPPLLARVNGQIEVLGFTARQRRAFLDAVMRYGMPPEDAYRSQWLVRDLRNKPEKVFRAYVSLFMRHLCEPVADDAEKFSDGVPREGLSRQHVLTRIGMMALIRRKVREFEPANGVNSLEEFGLPPVVVGAGGAGSKGSSPSSKSTSKEGTPDISTTKSNDEKKEEKEGKQDEKKDDKDKEEVNKDEKSEKSENKEDKDDKKDEGKTEDKIEGDEKTKKTDIEENKGDKNEKKDEENDKTKGEEEKKEGKDEPMEVEEKKDEAKTSKQEEDIEKGESKTDSQLEKEENKDGDDKSNEGKEENKETKKDQEKDIENERVSPKEGEEKMEVNEDVKSDLKQETVSEKEKNADSGKVETKVTDVKGELMEVDNKDLGESVKGDEKSDTKEEKMDTSETPKDKESDSSQVDSKENQAKAKDEKAKQDETVDSKDNKEKESKGEKTDSKDSSKVSTDKDNKKVNGQAKKSEVAKLLGNKPMELRERFYIADGGFTELQALWQYEETFLQRTLEYEVWHRRHDYWLLTGVVTHGYRHWQDILNDPRFEVLNRAFRTDAEKMRKAAFLNRRFQLLEQALVIEEQLRKAIKLNEALLSRSSRNKDQYSEVDQLAMTLRQIAARGNISSCNPTMLKLMAQIETLVGDIKAATYVTMPATLAKAPQAMMKHNVAVSSVQQMLNSRQQQAAYNKPSTAPKTKGSPVIVLE